VRRLFKSFGVKGLNKQNHMNVFINLCVFWVWSLGTVVDTLCRLRARRLGVRISVTARDVFPLQNIQNCFGAQPASFQFSGQRRSSRR
jgi:hypothetical protein